MSALGTFERRTFSGRLALACIILALGFALVGGFAARADPVFPVLTGRVVDQADLISPETEARLNQELVALETDTGDQLVVVTLDSLDGYEIEEYGYRLGRHWGIGAKETDSGVLLIVAPNERKVRVEVGYGLEAVLTDAFSALVVQNEILPAFREGGMERGIVRGVDALIAQLRLDREEAIARAAAAVPAPAPFPWGTIITIIVIFFFLMLIFSGGGGGNGRRRRSSTGPIIWSSGSSGGSSWSSGGSSWSGGGGFSGGGGSFGGGGASGGW